ncbi:MAG: hypothetical protein ACO1N3_05220 [Gammaproteobacteria bacterium]
MTQPRITHILNNGPLHVLTPELRQEIKLLARDQSNLKPQFMPAYEALKRRFAEFYEFSSPETFSWQQFAALVDSCSLFDLQLVLGPVLRSVMLDTMEANKAKLVGYVEEGNDVDSTITEYTTLLEDGCYAFLHPDLVFTFLTGSLGFSMVYHYSDSDTSRLPDLEYPELINLLEGRPCIDLYHFKETKDYYWERAANETELEDYEQDEYTHLRDVAKIFGAQTLTDTKIGFELLRLYMQMLAHAVDNPDEDSTANCDAFHLTVTQVRQFLFNHQYLPKEQALRFLGQITKYARIIIDKTPESEHADYDLVVQAILNQRDPRSRNYKFPLKQQPTAEQLEIAGKILPAKAPLSPEVNTEDDDNSSFYGSPCTYLTTTPNRPDSFSVYPETNLSSQRKKRILSTMENSPLSEISVQLFPDEETKKRQDFSGISYTSNFHLSPTAGSSFFWWRTMQFCLVLGGACAIVALLTCPAAAAYLGLSSVLGVTTTEISVAATFLAGTSALVAASLFAVHKISNEGVPPSATQRLSV